MGTVRMSDLLEQARAFDPSKAEPRTTSWAPLEEGFASDAQRRAAFASGYKEKGKKKDKKEDVDLDEAKATLSRFGGDRLKDSTMNLAKQRGLKVKDLGKDKIEISGNGKVVMALTLALQKKDVKINEDVDLDEKFSPKEIKMAIGVASDPRYKRGNYTGAVNAIEKIKKGLSQHPQVAAVLKRQNEEVELDEMKSKNYALAIKGEVVAVGSKAEMMQLQKNRRRAMAPSGDVVMSPGAKIGDMVEEVEIQEDGHTDVASAVRQCKTVVEDATQMMAKLQGMNPEDSLPSWWSNKLAVASNNMNKMRDYLLVPTTEALDKEDEPKVKEIIKKLKKASDAHAGQSKDLEKAVKEEVELDEKSEYGPDIKGEISQLQKMLKGLERGKKTPGKGFAKMKIKELIADLEKRQAQDDAVIKMRGSLPMRDRKLSMKKDMYPYGEEVELDEGKMKELHGYIQQGMSAREIAKKMKLDVKTIQALMPKKEEVELDEAVKEYDVKIKVGSKTNSYNIMDKDELSAAQSVLHSVMARSRTGGSPGLDAVRKQFPDMKSLKKKGISVSIKEEVELDDIKEETNSLVEASAAQAARDARRAMRSDPDMRSKGDTADVAATQGDVEKAANHIIMQLRKSVSMNGQKNVEFASGTQKVPAAIAQKVLDMYNKQRTSSDKSKFQMKIAKSYKDLLNAIKGK